MIIIHHRSGPLSGTTKRLDGRSGRIVFGRYDDCDVVYPLDMTLVARRHFAIVRKPSGHWTFDLFGPPFVAMNGIPAEPGGSVESGAIIELGRIGGPSFGIEILPETTADMMPLTEAQEPVEAPGALAIRAWATATRTRKLAVVGGSGIAIAGIVGLIAVSYLIYDQADRFDRAILEIVNAQNRKDAGRIDGEVRDRLNRAAFLVLVRDVNGHEQGQATAWPAAKNLLATNAHVASIRESLPTGAKMFVRAPGQGGNSYEVIDHVIHPGYELFSSVLHQSPPMVLSYGANFEKVNLTGGYDVALLRVKEELPQDAILRIADSQELASLKAGDPVAYAGYPQEQIIGSEMQTFGSTPEIQIGNVTSITDFFMLPPGTGQRHLIHHNLPATGGSSGSPIVGSNGNVVAVLNAGNLFLVPMQNKRVRVPSAALINYGQSVALVKDLIEENADSNITKDRAYWGGQLAKLNQGFEGLLQNILEGQRPRAAATPVLFGESTITLTFEDRKSVV